MGSGAVGSASLQIPVSASPPWSENESLVSLWAYMEGTWKPRGVGVPSWYMSSMLTSFLLGWHFLRRFIVQDRVVVQSNVVDSTDHSTRKPTAQSGTAVEVSAQKTLSSSDQQASMPQHLVFCKTGFYLPHSYSGSSAGTGMRRGSPSLPNPLCLTDGQSEGGASCNASL